MDIIVQSIKIAQTGEEEQMTSWNMPPGCSVSDIPGNTPADQASEALYDRIYEILDKPGFKEITDHWDEPHVDQLVNDIAKMVGDSWQDGYKNGQADEGMAREHAEDQKLEAELSQWERDNARGYVQPHETDAEVVEYGADKERDLKVEEVLDKFKVKCEALNKDYGEAQDELMALGYDEVDASEMLDEAEWHSR
jgi:hypothetical protein